MLTAERFMASTVMLNVGPPLLLLVSQVPQRIPVHFEGSGPIAHQAVEEIRRESVVAGGDRRVGGEDGGVGHRLAGFFQRVARGYQLAQSLQAGESGVALVHVVDGGFDARSAQGADAADAQDQLLQEPGVLPTAVEPGRNLAVLAAIL